MLSLLRSCLLYLYIYIYKKIFVIFWFIPTLDSISGFMVGNPLVVQRQMSLTTTENKASVLIHID